MKKRQHSALLWRASWFHKSGYQAPDQFVEFDPKKNNAKKEVIRLAKQKSRLGSFPKSWSVVVTNLGEN